MARGDSRSQEKNTGAFFVATLVLWFVSVIFEIFFSRRAELLTVVAGCFFYQSANWIIRFTVSRDPLFVNTSVSLLHSSITSLSVILILINQWIVNGPGKMFEHSQLFAATWPGAYPALCFSSGYFAYDQWDMLHYRLYSGLIPSILVHHLILLVCFTLALFRNITVNYLILTLICERAAMECSKTLLNDNIYGISSVFSMWSFLSESSKEDHHEESNKIWLQARKLLKSRLIVEDDFTWRLPTTKQVLGQKLKYVGGVDLSFSKEDPCIACGALVILDLDNDLIVVYEDFSIFKLQIPYVPGFLAFREAPVLLKLLEKMKSDAHSFYPQLLMVDGNGILHPQGFGSACHIGVLSNLPTIGIGKNLLHIDGLTQSAVKKSLEAEENCTSDLIVLTGHSGRTWGAAMRSTNGSSKPIFISIGHRISLHTAIEVVKMTCKYRVPEPIRQADIRSRAILQKHQICRDNESID